MDIQHLNVKWFVAHPEKIDLTDYPFIFSEWIQGQDFEELLIDVADYRHVPDGPGVVLIGHEANYSMDQTGGRLGLLYNRKGMLNGDAGQRIRQGVRAVLQAGRLLLSHPRQQGVLAFDEHELQFILNDRLLTPNTEEGFRFFENALRPVMDDLFGAYAVRRVSADPRQRLTVQVTSTQPMNPEAVLGH
jgi:hypothetical protein